MTVPFTHNPDLDKSGFKADVRFLAKENSAGFEGKTTVSQVNGNRLSDPLAKDLLAGHDGANGEECRIPS